MSKKLSKIFINFWFNLNEIGIFFGTVKQKGSLIAYQEAAKIWKKETFKKKVISIITFNWKPSEHLLEQAMKEVLYDDVFGYPSDYCEGLFKINHWHNSYEWNLSNLTDNDIQKSDSLNATAILLRTKHKPVTSEHLHLHLFERAPLICTLLHPIVIKIPVTSIQYCVEIHNSFAFNEIRFSEIETSDEIISYIYEIQNIQIKTALSLHELIYLIDYNEKNKGEALISATELSAIGEAELIISYLKSTIEKTIVLLGLIFNLRDLQDKKTHKAKIDALYKIIPEKIKQQFYFGLVEEFIKSENIEELNNYRTGLLHKKGISSLQPHSFIAQDAKDGPLRAIFKFLVEQHAKNSAVLIATYAILTDRLVELKPPDITPFDFPQPDFEVFTRILLNEQDSRASDNTDLQPAT